MKNSMNFILRMFMLCLTLSITGNLYAHPSHKHTPKKHRYYYYPRQNVYYDPVESVYFVWDRNYWKPVPYHWAGGYATITYSNSPRIEMWIASSHPYYYNVEHRRTYIAYRTPAPKPRAPRVERVYAESRPKPNVTFQLNIGQPQPVYREERVIIVDDHGHHPHHHHGHHPHPGRGPGHHPGHGKGHGHH